MICRQGHLDAQRNTWKLTAPFEAPEIQGRLLAVCGTSFDVSAENLNVGFVAKAADQGRSTLTLLVRSDLSYTVTHDGWGTPPGLSLWLIGNKRGVRAKRLVASFT